MSLPADMRDVIAQRARRLAQAEGEYVSDKALYVAAHRDLPCLRGFDMGYLPTLFAQVEESVSHLTGAERIAAAEMEQASLFGDLEKTSFDDPGRMVLPPQSRRLAGIEGQGAVHRRGPDLPDLVPRRPSSTAPPSPRRIKPASAS